MNKTELIEVMAKESGLSKNDTEKALNAFIGAVQNSLKEKHDITLVGFGSFAIKETAARTGRNFKTGEAINIKPRISVKFKPGKNLKDFVN